MKLDKFFHKSEWCKLCNSDELSLRLKLEPTAPAEWYFDKQNRCRTEIRVPLDLYQCKNCGHVQLVDIISHEELYNNYFYESNSSPGLRKYFEQYVDEIIDTLKLKKGQKILDIGSNDGTFLKFFKLRDFDVLGVEPSSKLCKISEKSHIKTFNEFFTSKTALEIKKQFGSYDMITANNVFAHNEYLSDMLNGVYDLLTEKGYFVFEVSNLYDTICNGVFDFIYHEHISYHSVKPLVQFLHSKRMRLTDVQRTPSKGGTLRCIATKNGNNAAFETSSVAEFINKEEIAGLYDGTVYEQLQSDIYQIGSVFRKDLMDLKQKNIKVIGYGASATVTTLIHQFKISHLIDFLVDDNEIRHGTYSPGYHIPVYHPDKILEEKNAAVVILAWRFETMIKEKNKNRFDGKIVLTPKLKRD